METPEVRYAYRIRYFTWKDGECELDSKPDYLNRQHAFWAGQFRAYVTRYGIPLRATVLGVTVMEVID